VQSADPDRPGDWRTVPGRAAREQAGRPSDVPNHRVLHNSGWTWCGYSTLSLYFLRFFLTVIFNRFFSRWLIVIIAKGVMFSGGKSYAPDEQHVFAGMESSLGNMVRTSFN
jgi:hypothetical protein